MISKSIDLFLLDAFHPLISTHKLKDKLKGNLKDCYAFSIAYDLRIIFYFEDASYAVFLSLGTHDNVY